MLALRWVEYKGTFNWVVEAYRQKAKRSHDNKLQKK